MACRMLTMGSACRTPGKPATVSVISSLSWDTVVNGPLTPSRTTKASPPRARTVRAVSTSIPSRKPDSSRVSASTRVMAATAMTKRRRRHPRSRRLASQISALTSWCSPPPAGRRYTIECPPSSPASRESERRQQAVQGQDLVHRVHVVHPGDRLGAQWWSEPVDIGEVLPQDHQERAVEIVAQGEQAALHLAVRLLPGDQQVPVRSQPVEVGGERRRRAGVI